MLQASFLEDMVTSCDEEESTETTWAADEEVTTTEELEARLRSHRLDNTAVGLVLSGVLNPNTGLRPQSTQFQTLNTGCPIPHCVTRCQFHTSEAFCQQPMPVRHSPWI